MHNIYFTQAHIYVNAKNKYNITKQQIFFSSLSPHTILINYIKHTLSYMGREQQSSSECR